jgi:hypothetical protein
MMDLIVIGASGQKCPAQVQVDIVDTLTRWYPNRVYYADDRETGFRMFEQNRNPEGVIVAYAPGVFGDAAGGSKTSPRIVTGWPTVLLTALTLDEAKSITWDEKDGVRATADAPGFVRGDDPRRYLAAAMAVLRPDVALNVHVEDHMVTLGKFLNGAKF